MKKILKKFGYTKFGYGYKRLSKEHTHWVTLFESGSLQMYCYFTEGDDEMGKAYDTGIINPTEQQFETLIEVFKIHD